MKTAIIGSGISGLTAAWLLHRTQDVTVFEANDYIGGHTHTIDVNYDGEQFAIDTGFIVYNDWTYPNFIALLEQLGVANQPTSMSFSVRCDRTNTEYNGSSLGGLFAQRRNLFRPRFHRMIRDILRFNRESLALLESDGGEPEGASDRQSNTDGEELTVDEYVKQHGYSEQFASQYLIPMGAAIWSCPPETFGKFPMRFIVEFYRNHGLLSVRNRPQWRVIAGGSHRYVEKLTAPFVDRIRLSSPVTGIERDADGVTIRATGHETERFEQVIFACHSDQALRILGDSATSTERELLGEFPYEENTAVLHTDPTVLPKRRRAWASWNYHVGKDWPGSAATLTYNMNILQSLNARNTYSVTLNSTDQINPERVIDQFVYHHPIYTTRRRAAQERHTELINQNRTSFCGAYWGYGFHEDGVNSALAVCRGLGVEPPW